MTTEEKIESIEFLIKIAKVEDVKADEISMEARKTLISLIASMRTTEQSAGSMMECGTSGFSLNELRYMKEVLKPEINRTDFPDHIGFSCFRKIKENIKHLGSKISQYGSGGIV